MTKKQAAAPPAPQPSGLITLVHITRSTVNLQQASQQGPLYCTPNRQKGDGTQRCLPAVRLVARHGCRMEAAASAIHSHQGWAGMAWMQRTTRPRCSAGWASE